MDTRRGEDGKRFCSFSPLVFPFIDASYTYLKLNTTLKLHKVNYQRNTLNTLNTLNMIYSRHLLFLSTLCITLLLASPSPPLPTHRTDVECSSDYGSANPHDGSGGGGFVDGCHPLHCNRLVFDNFLDEEGVERLKDIAEKAIEAGRGNGGRAGPTILVSKGGMRGTFNNWRRSYFLLNGAFMQ